MKSASKRKEEDRRRQVTEERRAIAKEVKEKPRPIVVPLRQSVASKIFIREGEERKNPTPTLADFTTAKGNKKGEFQNLPTNQKEIREYACDKKVPPIHPELAYEHRRFG